MSNWIVFCTLMVVLLGCATPDVVEGAYNKGVATYRVKDRAAARIYWSNAVEEGDESAVNDLGYHTEGLNA